VHCFTNEDIDMCPLCIGVATWYVAGATSAGGIAALFLKRTNTRNRDKFNGECGDTESKRAADLQPMHTAPVSRQ
jgi:hypothetical protein